MEFGKSHYLHQRLLKKILNRAAGVNRPGKKNQICLAVDVQPLIVAHLKNKNQSTISGNY